MVPHLLATPIRWSIGPPNFKIFHGRGSKYYSTEKEARNILINDYGCTITDRGPDDLENCEFLNVNNNDFDVSISLGPNLINRVIFVNTTEPINVDINNILCKKVMSKHF